MPRLIFGAAVAGCLLGLTGSVSPTQGEMAVGPQPNANPVAVLPRLDPTSELVLAAETIVWGRRTGDSLALLAGAVILASIETRPLERQKSSEGGAPSDKQKTAVLDVDGVLEEARELAGDDRALQGLIDDVEARRLRGRVGGPGEHLDRAQARAVDIYQGIEFEGGKPAAVSVIGDGDTDLDLVVADEFGIEICRASSYADRELCRWMPRWTGPFTIRVINKGELWNQYRLLTN